MKPNQCPRCLYDGTKKVEIGPYKGEIYKDGYYPENYPVYKKEIRIENEKEIEVSVHDRDENGKYKFRLRRRCPACGHNEDQKL